MERSWNADKQFFAQSYEDLDVLDSAVLVMPLVFFLNGEPLMRDKQPTLTGSI